MPEQITQFRSALHGYNREDVVSYLDRLTKDYEDKLKRLNADNARLREELAEANEALASAAGHAQTEQALKESEKALAETEKALSDAQTLATDLRNRNGDLELRIRELNEELEEARACRKAETLPLPLPEPAQPEEAPQPEPPAGPDYTELELAAYRRAELTERLARDRAEEVYRQVQSVFGQASAKLSAGRTELEQLCRAISKDASELSFLLNGLDSAYRQAETAFGEIGAHSRGVIQAAESEQ